MNRMKQRLLTFMISAALVIGIFPAIPAIADTDDNTSSEESIYVLYTNDVHCEVSGYPALAAYRAQLLENGENVVTVDAGDAIQGEAIGAQTKGSAIIDIMNTVGYDYAIPGNHEFDYSLSTFLDLTKMLILLIFQPILLIFRPAVPSSRHMLSKISTAKKQLLSVYARRKLTLSQHRFISRMRTETIFTVFLKIHFMKQYRIRLIRPGKMVRISL